MEALRVLHEHLTDSPNDDWAVERYGIAFEAAHAEASPTTDEARQQRQELAQFTDRDRLSALPAALEHYVPRSRYATPMAEHVQKWLDAAGLDDSVPDSPVTDSNEQGTEQLGRLAYEHALVAASRTGEPADFALAAFANDSGTTPEVAARTGSWFEHARYGLWQISDHTRSPDCGDTTS